MTHQRGFSLEGERSVSSCMPRLVGCALSETLRMNRFFMNGIACLRSTNPRGFSTLETLVVVAIVTAGTSFAVYQASTRQNSDSARECAQCFVTAIRDACELSIEKQISVTMNLDPKTKPVRWVFRAAAGSHGPDSTWDLPVDEGMTVSGTVVPIRFNGSGNASYFGEWQIQGRRSYKVTLEPVGAKVSMKNLNESIPTADQ
jgi:type II secretory pathway pseudopilin PulG